MRVNAFGRVVGGLVVGVLVVGGLVGSSAGAVPVASPAEVAPAGAGVVAQPAIDNITLHIQPGAGYRPITDFIGAARRTLDYNIYQFNDETIADALIAAHRRGVKVRVMFTWQVFPAGSNQWNPASPYYNTNMPTYYRLRAAGVKVRLSPYRYTYSHEKTMVADGSTREGRALIMDFNAQPSYIVPTPGLLGTRGFAITTGNQFDVHEIQRVFDADWNRLTPPAYASPRLVWSPSGVGYQPPSQGKQRIFEVIDGARRSVDVYALLLDYLPFQKRLMAAAERGVRVRVITNSEPSPMTSGQAMALTDAGVEIRVDPTYPAGPIFVHSKAIIRDAGSASAVAFVGSQNPGDNVSTNSERELGILIGNPGVIERMHRVFVSDWVRTRPGDP